MSEECHFEAAVVEEIKMEEKLEAIHRLRLLQLELINVRNNTIPIRKCMKQTCLAELKNLRNLEVSIPETEIKLPDPSKWPVKTKIEILEFNVDTILKDYENTMTALDFLK